ncbi:MBL fold metallo-hydrolase [Chloroflexota bacterium]
MKIKWLGHATFLITSDAGIKIITDPYVPTDELRYGEISESAYIVTVSHDHFDHNNVASVRGKPEVARGTTEVKGIKFRSIATYHDESQGEKRGKNTVFCFELDGIKICHLGDLGHLLTDKQASEIGEVDILLIPVGGFYTIDASAATKVCDRLKPRVIIPMHFKTNKCSGLPISGVDAFLKGKTGVAEPDGSEVEFKRGELPASTRITVLKPAL